MLMGRQDRFRARPFQYCRLGDGSALVRPLGQREQVIPSGVIEYLRRCTQFNTLPGHIANLYRLSSHVDDNTGRVGAILKECVKRGFLVSEAELYTHGSADNSSRQSVSTIAIITAHRFAECLQAVKGIVCMSREAGRRLDLVIMDDSCPRSKPLEHLLPHLQAIDTHGAIRYAGRIERERYATALSKRGFDPELAQFAVLGGVRRFTTTVGSTRNCVLLDTLGKSIVMTDDDIVLRTARHPQYSGRLRILCDQNPRDFWFFRNRREVIEELSWSSANIFAEHEAMLGAPITRLLRDAERTDGVCFEDTCDHLLSGLLSDTATVAMTATGIAGDSGFGFAPWFLSSEGRTRDRLLGSESVYSTATTSRETLGVACSPTVNHSCWCMAGSIGLDNRVNLPPFLPIARSEDWVFGTLLFKCFPHYFTGHIPLAVLHNSNRLNYYDAAPMIRVGDLIRYLVHSFGPPHGTNGFVKLRLFGRLLRDLSMLPVYDLCKHLGDVVREQQTRRIQEVEKMLTFSDTPNYWRRDLQEWQRRMSALLADPLCFIPAELRARSAGRAAITNTRQLLHRTGRLFYSWPDLVDASAEMKQQGYQICLSIM